MWLYKIWNESRRHWKVQVDKVWTYPRRQGPCTEGWGWGLVQGSPPPPPMDKQTRLKTLFYPLRWWAVIRRYLSSFNPTNFRLTICPFEDGTHLRGLGTSNTDCLWNMTWKCCWTDTPGADQTICMYILYWTKSPKIDFLTIYYMFFRQR